MPELREALAARSDDDVVTSAPRRRTAPARRGASTRRAAPAKGKAAPGLGARLFASLLRHPREVLTTVLIAGCGAAIAWNALLLQKVRHPAPLFAHEDPRPAPAPAPAQPARSVPAASAVPSEIRPPEASYPPPLPPHPPADTAPAAPAPVPPSRSAIADLIAGKGEVSEPRRVSAAKAPTPRDAIADIIRMGGPVPIPPGNVGREEAGNPVLAGQRALAKLGYDVKPDGVMGNETRQAIERFERDRHLPVTGELGARTVRELAARSGIPVP